MPFAIRVKKSAEDQAWLFEKKFATRDEFEAVRMLCKSRSRVGLIPATLITVRTDNLKDFAKDFFLPTVINHALKVHHVVGRVFAALASAILDIVTLPIRVITLIPRLIVNALYSKDRHPLHKYLKGNNADPALLNEKHVFVELESVDQRQHVLRANEEQEAATPVPYKGAETFNFIRLPETVSPMVREGDNIMKVQPPVEADTFRSSGLHLSGRVITRLDSFGNEIIDLLASFVSMRGVESISMGFFGTSITYYPADTTI